MCWNMHCVLLGPEWASARLNKLKSVLASWSCATLSFSEQYVCLRSNLSVQKTIVQSILCVYSSIPVPYMKNIKLMKVSFFSTPAPGLKPLLVVPADRGNQLCICIILCTRKPSRGNKSPKYRCPLGSGLPSAEQLSKSITTGWWGPWTKSSVTYKQFTSHVYMYKSSG